MHLIDAHDHYPDVAFRLMHEIEQEAYTLTFFVIVDDGIHRDRIYLDGPEDADGRDLWIDATTDNRSFETHGPYETPEDAIEAADDLRDSFADLNGAWLSEALRERLAEELEDME